MTKLICSIMLAGLTCSGQEKKAGVDEGLRQAFERVVYRLKDSGPGRLQGINPAQQLTLEFNSDGARLEHPLGDVALRLTAYGYGGRLLTPLQAKPTASGNRVEYRRGELSEWYVNDSRGLEQGFTLAQRPPASRDGEPLVIALGVAGDLRPELTAQGDAVLLRSSKGAVLRYAGLKAWDARGRMLVSRLQVGEREVRLVVDDHGAEYPLVVDPVLTQQTELTASDGKVGDNFGWSVAVSGTTAVVGAFSKKVGSNVSQGTAYVFVHTGTTWVQQQELTASDGKASDNFGWSVAVSGDTVVVGAPQKNIGSNVAQGAAYVYVVSGGTWSLQQELTASDGTNFGYSVSLDGNTAVVGASGTTVNSNPNQGAVYVLVRSGTTWTQQQKLTASDGATNDILGFSVAVNGNTAVVGAYNKKVGSNRFQGAAYVFVRSGSAWNQEQELTASDGAANDGFGYFVAVNGATALVGAPNKKVGLNAGQGAAYVFVGSGGAWSEQQELTANNGAAGDSFGYSVGVFSNMALVGAVFKEFGANTNQGAAYTFVRSGATWGQRQELIASDGASMNWFGSSVALDANTAVVGATWRNSTTGAAYVFREPYIFNDFAGNGLSGALLYDPSMGQEYTALSNGDGTYTYVPNLFTAGFNILRTGDFNGDGIADLILYNSGTALAYIGFGNGDGTFNFQSLFWSPGYNFVATGDLNGDGITDVALYNSTTGTMYTGISNGDGTFTYKYTLISSGYTFLRLTDFNGDGKADIFLYRVSDGLANLGFGNGTGGFAFSPVSISAGYNLIDTGDLTGQGNADLILYNATNGNAATGIFTEGGGTFFIFSPLIFSPGFTSVRLGYFTGHDTADLTVYDKNTGAAYFGTGTGTGTFNFQSLFWSPGYDYTIPEDVNGDGKTDIVLYNSATGTEYTGISNGDGTFTYTYSYWGIGKLLAQ